MENRRPWHVGSDVGRTSHTEADDERTRELAEAELCAAIAIVGENAGFRVLVCGMATDAALVAGLDDLAAGAGVVLERRIRPGGGLDVVVRAA
jgi:hypothetical protein